jgi:cold shock CspA family protein
MAIGKIIKLADVEKGWGFIVSKEFPCERIYFHWSNLVQETLRFPKLKKNMMVEFTVRETPDRGLRAYRITVIEPQEVKDVAS